MSQLAPFITAACWVQSTKRRYVFVQDPDNLDTVLCTVSSPGEQQAGDQWMEDLVGLDRYKGTVLGLEVGWQTRAVNRGWRVLRLDRLEPTGSKLLLPKGGEVKSPPSRMKRVRQQTV